jgi:nucleoid-associated protein YgaU
VDRCRSLTDSAPVRATLTTKDPAESVGEITFTFNPTEYTITANTLWKQTPAKGKGAPKSEYTGNLPRTIAMDILFVDNWTGREGFNPLNTTLGMLMDLTTPSHPSIAKGKPSSPVLLFTWGDIGSIFDCHLKQVTIKYQMFDEAGNVTRAVASILLEEVLSETPRQNPTSGGPSGNRAHVVSDGDSLASIAWREYDNAALWRGLADLNGIDDPMALRVGQRLIVPPYEHVAARS